MNRCDVSILITYFNEGEMLRECLQSLQRQTIQPDEIIVYDDCSELRAEQFLLNDYPVRLIRGDVNVGAGSSRNNAFAHSRGSYVHFHDADDIFCPEWCEQIKNLLSAAESEVDLVVTDRLILDLDGKTSLPEYGLEWMFRQGHDLLSVCVGQTLLPVNCTYNRRLFAESGGYLAREVLAISEDFEFHLRLALKVNKLELLWQPLVVQRLRANSLCRENGELRRDALMAHFIAIERNLPALPEPYKCLIPKKLTWCCNQLLRKNRLGDAWSAFNVLLKTAPTLGGKMRIAAQLLILVLRFVRARFVTPIKKLLLNS